MSNNIFQKYVPTPWKLYEMRISGCEKDILSVVYYIGSTLLTIKEFKQEASTLPAYIETIWKFSTKEIYINFVNATISKCGFGTLLLYMSIITSREEGIETVILDDSSDRYRKNNNIYSNIGLRYSVKDDGPEMEGHTKNVERKWRRIRKKYIN